MPNPNAIVSNRIRLEPPLDRGSPEELLRAPDGMAVEFDERRVRLDPANPRSPGFARVLDGLRQQNLPAYVEVDPATNTITLLLVPNVARVVAVTPSADGLDVELDASHARHSLRRGDADAVENEALLREALADRRPLVITEDDSHNIIDVRAFTPPPDWPEPPFPVPPGVRPWPWKVIDYLTKLIRWFLEWLRWRWFGCVSRAKARQAFDAMAATSCDPLTVPSPCIPFLFPDDGCWARAHEMCRLMIDMGLAPRKVWIDHSPGHWLHANTRNHPQCFVNWGWHVAPTLCVRRGWLWHIRVVIDPSLFTKPVSLATWKGVQGDPAATLTEAETTPPTRIRTCTWRSTALPCRTAPISKARHPTRTALKESTRRLTPRPLREQSRPWQTTAAIQPPSCSNPSAQAWAVAASKSRA
jgi:hypothetical protein